MFEDHDVNKKFKDQSTNTDDVDVISKPTRIEADLCSGITCTNLVAIRTYSLSCTQTCWYLVSASRV